MADLTAHFKTTKHLIDIGGVFELPRPYLGMSQLGHHCPRFLWYSFRWAFIEAHSSRIKRLFARGHREEPEIVKELEKIGIRCYGDQDEVVTCEGHIKGHRDGACIGVIEAPKTEHLSEFKTASDKKFKEFVKLGCEKANPQYFGQTQSYMKYWKLTRTLFIVVNKNNDEWYIERIRYNKGVADDLDRIGEFIVASKTPPAKPYGKTFYKCKWCAAKEVCHNGGLPPKTCRTCTRGEPAEAGTWACSLTTTSIPLKVQQSGCSKYRCRLD